MSRRHENGWHRKQRPNGTCGLRFRTALLRKSVPRLYTVLNTNTFFKKYSSKYKYTAQSTPVPSVSSRAPPRGFVVHNKRFDDDVTAHDATALRLRLVRESAFLAAQGARPHLPSSSQDQWQRVPLHRRGAQCRRTQRTHLRRQCCSHRYPCP